MNADSLFDYATRRSVLEPDVLRRLREETEQTVARPHMLSGPLQGALLRQLVQLTRATRVLEIGTFTGYAAICLAQGLPETGLLHTIELDAGLRAIADRYFREAGLASKIVAHTGRALDVLNRLDGPFDLVFLDADKKGYRAYFEAVLPKMPAGGLLIADNVLFRGEVTLPDGERGALAEAIHRFNEAVAADPRVEPVLLPLRDGLSLIRKRSF